MGASICVSRISGRPVLHHRLPCDFSVLPAAPPLGPCDESEESVECGGTGSRGGAESASIQPRRMQETGGLPAKAVQGLRVEASRFVIKRSRHSLEVVARAERLA